MYDVHRSGNLKCFGFNFLFMQRFDNSNTVELKLEGLKHSVMQKCVFAVIKFVQFRFHFHRNTELLRLIFLRVAALPAHLLLRINI